VADAGRDGCARHVALPWVDTVKVSEVVITPTLPAAADEVFALDGELVPLAPLRLRVLPGRITTLQGPTPRPTPPAP
jgi:diacylglycerol kinase family enzyme